MISETDVCHQCKSGTKHNYQHKTYWQSSCYCTPSKPGITEVFESLFNHGSSSSTMKSLISVNAEWHSTRAALEQNFKPGGTRNGWTHSCCLMGSGILPLVQEKENMEKELVKVEN